MRPYGFGFSPSGAAGGAGGAGGASAIGLPVVEPLDFASLRRRGDEVALRLLRDVARGLVLHLIEGRKGLYPLFLDLDDMPAELALDGFGNLARLELERGVGKFGNHPVLGEPAEVAALAAGVLGKFGRDLGEVLASLHAGERRLGDSSSGSRICRAWISGSGGWALAAAS